MASNFGAIAINSLQPPPTAVPPSRSAQLPSIQMLTNLRHASVFRIKGVVDLVGRGPTLVQFVEGNGFINPWLSWKQQQPTCQ